MDAVATAFLGFVTALLGIFLTVLTLSSKLKSMVISIIHEVLWTTGMLNRDPGKKIWPNGYDDLPEFLAGMHNDMKELKAAVKEHQQTMEDHLQPGEGKPD